MTKLWKKVALFSLVGPLYLVAQNGGTTPNNGNMQQNNPPMQNNQPNMAPKGKADCSQLSPDEQDFATQLSAPHRMVFCNKFDSEMRASAMEAAGQMGTSGMLVTNDQAVEQVARDNNMMMPMAPAKRQSSGCPAK